MQVDPSPMNVGDGGTVSRESGAPNRVSGAMVGNPPQTLPPQLRGDVPHSQQGKLRIAPDCKMPDICSEAGHSNHCPEVPPSTQAGNGDPSSPPLNATQHERAGGLKPKSEGGPGFHGHQWTCGKKVAPEAALNSCQGGGVAPNKKPHAAAPSVISLPPGLQCSALFKPGQPVAFLPSTNFPSPLCKITLPPGLGQIATLREAVGSQFQKVPETEASLLRSYPYHFSVGRGPASEKRLPASKLRGGSGCGGKSSKLAPEVKTPAASVAPPSVTLPVQPQAPGSAPPTHFAPSPSAAVLANVTPQSRASAERASPYRAADTAQYLKLKTPPRPSEEYPDAPPNEARDAPLDLSSKSKRQSCGTKELQNNVATESHQRKRAQSAGFAVSPSFPLSPDAQRHAAALKPHSAKHSNHQTPEAAASRAKASPQLPAAGPPGTYVGVASPILASTLRSRDGKGAAFLDDLQALAKQETISIIDQGEQLSARAKKPPHPVKGTQHGKSSKLPNSACSAPSGPANSHGHRKSLVGKAGVQFSPKPSWLATSAPRDVPQGTPKVKRTAGGGDGGVFRSPRPTSPTRTEEETWGGSNKSPLSNLESIVKQKAMETSALTGEARSRLATPGPRRPENPGLISGFQQTAATGFLPFRPADKREPKPERLAFQGDPSPSGKRQEKQYLRDGEERPYFQKIPPPTPLGSGGSLGEGAEGSLPKQLCGDSEKEAPPSQRKLEGFGLSVVQGKSAIEKTQEEGKTNGTKDDPASKGKGAASKQKNPGLKKTSKGKTTSEDQKKTAVLKQPVGKQENTPKKKKSPSLAQENSRSKEAFSAPQEQAEKTCKGKSGGRDVTEPLSPSHANAGGDTCTAKSPQRLADKLGSVVSPALPGADSPKSPSPRPRRGHKRPEEALRNEWSLTTPPSPPLPPHPNPLSAARPPPSQTHSEPLRRRRGRPRVNPLPEDTEVGRGRLAQHSDVETHVSKKRRRCRNRKYQNGEYIVEKDKAVCLDKEERNTRQSTRVITDGRSGVYPRLNTSPGDRSPSPDLSPRRPLLTRSGSARRLDSQMLPEPKEKPAGKRKFKSKHLISDAEEQKKLKTKRGSLGKHPTSAIIDEESPEVKKPAVPFACPKSVPSSPPDRKGSVGKGGAPDLTPGRPVPPEVRRLIVNKNAGETLLQRAARLGYQEVVLYCLEKDVREVNRRDNAGYTALHEACARGWTHIIQMLLEHGADVNCSAQDGTRPIHDAVAADNLPAVWMLLNHGADPTLATYSGQTAVKLAQSASMKTFLKEYFTDLEGRADQDPGLQWEFYSSAVFETDQEPCWDFLLSVPEEEDGEERKEQDQERDMDSDCLLFEFSDEPLLPCYHIQVEVTQGFCNWFLMPDVLKRMKMSARIFRARYPHMEVASVSRAELKRQVSISQTCSAPSDLQTDEEEEEEQEQEEETDEGDATLVELVRCVPELQRLLGSSLHLLRLEEEEEEEDEEGVERDRKKSKSER
ncbi:BCL-6 corepressor-like protein 1 isoform X2 [Denticeps clupeoides]|uniref:BCL-6 corepressor-like protein 1 isoform X2 n=1 Tax=Denticeps clupeoides TaxID=299321 RepID=UPI0010A34A56|nr:BCL-6 corepressor-like protein 1 isoform X2 [Denticeps clupeoides]